MWEMDKVSKVSSLEGLRQQQHLLRKGAWKRSWVHSIWCGHELWRFITLALESKKKGRKERKFYLDISSELNQLLFWHPNSHISHLLQELCFLLSTEHNFHCRGRAGVKQGEEEPVPEATCHLSGRPPPSHPRSRSHLPKDLRRHRNSHITQYFFLLSTVKRIF